MNQIGEVAVKFIFKIIFKVFCYLTGEIILSIFSPRKMDDESDETTQATKQRIQTATMIGIFFWVDIIIIVIIYNLAHK